jgi:hypothetical protein
LPSLSLVSSLADALLQRVRWSWFSDRWFATVVSLVPSWKMLCCRERAGPLLGR